MAEKIPWSLNGRRLQRNRRGRTEAASKRARGLVRYCENMREVLSVDEGAKISKSRPIRPFSA